MFRLNMELTVLRLQQEVEGLRRQLDDVQSEVRLLRRSAILDAADTNAARCDLKRLHLQQLAALRKEHEQKFAAEVAADRDRLRASVGPILADLQRQQTRLMEEAKEARQREEALEEELVMTRQLVFDALSNPAEVLARLGL